MKKGTKRKMIAKNRKAWFNYSISDTLEAGIVLLGSEVKSLREGKASMGDCYGKFERGEIWLVGCHISEYTFSNQFNHEPLRERKLLLHKREIKRWSSKVAESGYTVVPLCLYFKEGRVKVELGLAKGKKSYDKRHDIKKRDMARDAHRELKDRY